MSAVTSLTLDVTDAAQIRGAVEKVDSLDLLINNAGLQPFDDLSDRSVLERTLAINLIGPYDMIRAFLPLLTRSRGAVVNNVSLSALAPVPFAPAYSISKAAAFSLTRSLRVLLAGRGVRVHAVLAGPIDTEMTHDLDDTESLDLGDAGDTGRLHPRTKGRSRLGRFLGRRPRAAATSRRLRPRGRDVPPLRAVLDGHPRRPQRRIRHARPGSLPTRDRLRPCRRRDTAPGALQHAHRRELADGADRSRHRRNRCIEAAAGQSRLRRRRPGTAQQPHQRRPDR